MATEAQQSPLRSTLRLWRSSSGRQSSWPRGGAVWAGLPVAALGLDGRPGRQRSAYLIRSRPSGRKINSVALCYCSAGGRAATRAQHNIYTVVARRALAGARSAYTCHAFRDAHTAAHTAAHTDQKQVLTWIELEEPAQDQQRLRSLCLRMCDLCTNIFTQSATCCTIKEECDRRRN